MTDRDRLIELIQQGKNKTPCQNDCDGKVCKDCEIESIADYLLANGVIVPPEELYSIVDKGTIYATVSKVIVEWLPLYVIKEPEKYGYYKTKEKAEKALAERSDNNAKEKE